MGHTQGGAESGAVDARHAVQAPDLAEVVGAWPGLPPATRAAVVAMVRQAGGK
jgi:hypothetical protein